MFDLTKYEIAEEGLGKWVVKKLSDLDAKYSKEYRDRVTKQKEKDRNSNPARSALLKKYNLNSPEEINAFKKKMNAAIFNEAKKICRDLYNNKDLMNKYQEKVNDDSEMKRDFKNGKFLLDIYFSQVEEYIEIVPTQDLAIEINVHDKVCTLLKEKYKELIDGKILKLDTGDGDEGCVFIEWEL